MEHIPVETKDFSSPSVFFVSPSLFVNQDIGKDDETENFKTKYVKHKNVKNAG